MPPPQTVFSHLNIAMEVAAIWALRMDAHLASGKPAEAMEDMLDGLRLYRALEGEPALLSGLVRQSVLFVIRRSVEHGLTERRWRAEDLVRIEAELATVDLVADARRAFSSERGFINDASETLRRRSVAERVKQTEEFDLRGEEPRGWRLWLRLVSGIPWREQVRQNQILDHRLMQVQPGFDHYFAKPALAADLAEVHLATLTEVISRQYLALEMSLRQTRLVCALEQFRLARGAYPLALQELFPEFAATWPADVIDGQPVRYRRLEDGKFLLYSIGANARDDDGSAKFDPWIAGTFKARDWVWGELWK